MNREPDYIRKAREEGRIREGRSAADALGTLAEWAFTEQRVNISLPHGATIAGTCSVNTDINSSEGEFQKAVIELAQFCGWKVAHFRKAQAKDDRWITAVAGDGKGWPDLVLVREKVLYRELKSLKGIVSEDQREWGRALLAAKQDYSVWRPSDWPEITQVLAEPRRC